MTFLPPRIISTSSPFFFLFTWNGNISHVHLLCNLRIMRTNGIRFEDRNFSSLLIYFATCKIESRESAIFLSLTKRNRWKPKGKILRFSLNRRGDNSISSSFLPKNPSFLPFFFPPYYSELPLRTLPDRSLLRQIREIQPTPIHRTSKQAAFASWHKSHRHLSPRF